MATTDKEAMEVKIAQWKKRWPTGVYRYESEDGKAAYLHAPDRSVIGAAIIEAQGDPVRHNEFVLNNCWIEGDECLRKEDRYFLGLQSYLDSMVEMVRGSLKKL